MQAPEIQTMYTLSMPVSTLRTKMRQEFERHRYVTQLKTVDVLLFNSHQEFQVRVPPTSSLDESQDFGRAHLSATPRR
jgi:NADH dehydrogenase (ubiquinone) 1 alpha subcomplex subunit 6